MFKAAIIILSMAIFALLGWAGLVIRQDNKDEGIFDLDAYRRGEGQDED